MRVVILHNSFNPTGGAERLSLAVIEALKEKGHEVILCTTDKTDWKLVENAFGKITKPDEEISLIPFRLKLFGIYQRILPALHVRRLKKKNDLVLNTHGDVLPIKCDITYMHFPTFLFEKELPINLKYQKNLFWKAYFIPYGEIQRFLVKKYLKGTKVLTNSNFSKEIIKKYLKKKANVVYPPVNVKEFFVTNDERQDIIVTTGRITPEKNYEIIPDIAKNVPTAQFYIIGATSKVSKAILNTIKKKIDQNNIDNIKIYTNMAFTDLKRLYSKAKVYLHTMKNEHFGISIVEAMAAGLVPIVHKSGGPWKDIIEKGKYGLGWTNFVEASNNIKQVLSDKRMWKQLSIQARERSIIFSKKKFKQEIIKLLNL